MSRRLLAPAVAIALGCASAAPAAAEHPTDLVQRIGRLPAELVKAKKTDAEIVDALFLATMSRLPKESEKETALKHMTAGKDRGQAALDLTWALVVNKEFLKLHGLDKDVAESLKLLKLLVDEWEKEDRKDEKK